MFLYNLGQITSRGFRSVQFSRSVVSDSLQPHESQHARPPCPSPTPRVHSDSCLSSRWCHPAISSSVIPFSSCPQSLPACESFPMSRLFAWGGQSTGVSALASFLPKNTCPSYYIKWDISVFLQLHDGLRDSSCQIHIGLLWAGQYFGCTVGVKKRCWVGIIWPVF